MTVLIQFMISILVSHTAMLSVCPLVTRPSREVLPNLFVCPLPSVELSPG